jgi:hypothetical protein
MNVLSVPSSLPLNILSSGGPGQGVFSMDDAQIHAKAVIAAAIIQSRGVDVEGLASNSKDISNRKLAHLRELTERIYNALSGVSTD